MVADFKHGPPRRFAKQFLASVLPRAVRLRRRTDAPRDRRAAVTAPATDAHVDLPAAPRIVRGDEPAGSSVTKRGPTTKTPNPQREFPKSTGDHDRRRSLPRAVR